MTEEQIEAMDILEYPQFCTLSERRKAHDFIKQELKRLEERDIVIKSCANCVSWNEKCSDEDTLCKDWKAFIAHKHNSDYEAEHDGKMEAHTL